MTNAERRERELAKFLEEIGPSQSVQAFLDEYGNINTKYAYTQQLCLYFRYLRGRGIGMTPDELITDNLTCISTPDPVDVLTKSRHLSWLKDYLNSILVRERASESKRKTASQAVRLWYRANNSDLWGHYKMSKQREKEGGSCPPLLWVEALVRLMRTPSLISPDVGFYNA